MAEGLQGEYAREFPLFSQRSAALQKRIAEMPVGVLLWGPGPHTSHFAKRKAISEHLNGLPGQVEAIMSEDLWEKDPYFKEMDDPYDAEELQLGMVDIIFVIIVTELDERGLEITGSQTEVVLYGRHPSFAEKGFVIVPEVEPRSFLSYGWRSIPVEHKFKYTVEQYADCTHIRSFCEAVVERLRRKRYLQGQRVKNL